MRAFGFRLVIQFPAALFHSRIEDLWAEDKASLFGFPSQLHFFSLAFSFEAALGKGKAR